ncbi:MAG: 4-(cytidine 5'-diphospho)-2-C-methyl-D-erythritol kinase [Campylobacterales bacterium]|nr:4-(cytidine 5'-diphospho)-2-C-methyl-D-erythritol kinase [Campylobacterales bacterium]
MIRYSAYAKVNVFLKITGKQGEYHTLSSRFMRVNTLFDTLWFEPKTTPEFEIRGSFDCDVRSNTIYKAYKYLLAATRSEKLSDFMETHAVCVDKKIPSFAGLGGGSSDAATFLRMCNEELELGLSLEELADIGANVGADVPFFVYGYPSANVRGIGEIVEPFDEPLIGFEVVTPPLQISNPAVYRYYRDRLYAPISAEEASRLEATPSREILASLTPEEANDLYRAALGCYPELEKREGWFFSGSGSSFFRLRDNP